MGILTVKRQIPRPTAKDTEASLESEYEVGGSSAMIEERKYPMQY